MMPHEGCSEVLRDACALTLGDEPLASGVEHGPVQLRMEAAEVSVPLHNLVDSEVSPNVVGISPKIPPVGLFSGESNISIGSHKTKMRKKLSSQSVINLMAFGVMQLSSNRTP